MPQLSCNPSRRLNPANSPFSVFSHALPPPPKRRLGQSAAKPTSPYPYLPSLNKQRKLQSSEHLSREQVEKGRTDGCATDVVDVRVDVVEVVVVRTVVVVGNVDVPVDVVGREVPVEEVDGVVDVEREVPVLEVPALDVPVVEREVPVDVDVPVLEVPVLEEDAPAPVAVVEVEVDVVVVDVLVPVPVAEVEVEDDVDVRGAVELTGVPLVH